MAQSSKGIVVNRCWHQSKHGFSHIWKNVLTVLLFVTIIFASSQVGAMRPLEGEQWLKKESLCFSLFNGVLSLAQVPIHALTSLVGTRAIATSGFLCHQNS
ncbi:hypothetical protein CFP56_021751 [Quercus suber]|uniref:Uncharacterized protein n=1 Tax=Quercus suber TaxID=58331 RepID=A0AAW0KF31_QUESU